VGLFSRVCSARTPGRIYRWNQENAASTGVQGPSGMGTGHQPPVLSRKEGMERLRSQADELKRKISDIESSIESLEKG
jgi:hypothetical protein